MVMAGNLQRQRVNEHPLSAWWMGVSDFGARGGSVSGSDASSDPLATPWRRTVVVDAVSAVSAVSVASRLCGIQQRAVVASRPGRRPTGRPTAGP